MRNRTDELAARDNYHGQATWRRIIEAVASWSTRRRPVHCIDDRKFRSAVGSIKSDPLPGRRSITAKGSGSAGVERSAAALCGSGSFQAESYQVVRMPGPAAGVKRIAPLSKWLNTRELVRASGCFLGSLGSTLG